MNIREADITDKNRWDLFIDSEGGDYRLYYNWKQFYETRGNRFIPLIVESDSSELLGIPALVKENKFLFSVLKSLPEGGGGFLIRSDLSESEKNDVVCELIKYVDLHYTKGCAVIFIQEINSFLLRNKFIKQHSIPISAQIESGLKYEYDETTGFPCSHVVETKRPFEEHHWKIWSRNIRQNINKAIKSGVTVVYDRDLVYMDQFIAMLSANYKRHKNNRFINDEMKVRFNVFKEKIKLYIALRNGQPVAGLLCQYTPLTCHLSKMGSYFRNDGSAEKLCLKVAIEEACNTGYKYIDFGISVDENTAFYKGQFRFTRVPIGLYTKNYSATRYYLYEASRLLINIQENKMYLWNNREKIIKKISKIGSKIKA
ncbi:MAG: GNAT family N-acetyltransferase [Acidobacteria bacterium]|nr:GNAT family N-acetyltransferase [Acidobacteriota bacterium]